jgi:hypothetical protein
MNDHEPGVETLFWGALQQPSSAAQAAYLDRACGDDKQLRHRLDCLLAAYQSGAEFLEQPAPSVGRLRDQIDGQTSSVSTSALRTLGDYRILREVGRGGMGVVYEAEQISLNRRVALKVLPFASVLDQKQLQRFKNEARAAASLDHPNIVRVHQIGCERGVHYYAMQYIEGRTLAELIAELRRDAGLAEGEQLRGTASRNAPPISGVETTVESQPQRHPRQLRRRIVDSKLKLRLPRNFRTVNPNTIALWPGSVSRRPRRWSMRTRWVSCIAT